MNVDALEDAKLLPERVARHVDTSSIVRIPFSGREHA